MKSKTGVICMLLGALLMLGSLVLYCINWWEDAEAQLWAVKVVPQLVQEIQNEAAKETTAPQDETIPEPELQVPAELLTEEDKVMDEVEIDGYLYIGYLSIPSLELDLPVMSMWSYDKLRIAPCRYSGTIKGEDLVIMAHNYASHFGNLSQMELGDLVQFTDVNGTVTEYEVVGTDVLMASAVDEMTSGVYDLTLFTCTFGGRDRVTVYCDCVK